MKKVLILIITIFIITSSIILFKYITEDKVVKIGLVTDLSGKNSTLGVSARNGLELAIEEINNNGGINNYIVELLVEDHIGSKDKCKELSQSLVEQGVKAIISPIISGMATSVIDGVGDSDVLIIGPTVSTDLLTEIDDNFISSSAPASIQGIKIAGVSIENNDKRVILVIDHKNSSYSTGVAKGFMESLKGSDIEIVKIFEFTENLELENLIPELIEIETDAIFFITNGIDSGKIIQRYAKKKTLPHLYGSSWVKAGGVQEYGGRRVEGMILADSFVNVVPIKTEVEFAKKYRDKFGMEPNTIAIYFYESLYLYKSGVVNSKGFEVAPIIKAISELDNIKGITEDYTINKYGDGERKIILYIIKGNKFEFYKEQK